MSESRHDKFLRVAEKRLNKCLDEIRKLKNLSSGNYQNTDEEAEAIIKHLDDAIDEVANAFKIKREQSVSVSEDPKPVKNGPADEEDVYNAVQALKNGDSEEALDILEASMNRSEETQED